MSDSDATPWGLFALGFGFGSGVFMVAALWFLSGGDAVGAALALLASAGAGLMGFAYAATASAVNR